MENIISKNVFGVILLFYMFEYWVGVFIILDS
jgi:hypothetical protein